MRKEHLLMVGFSLIALLGVLFLGTGITGMVVMDETVRPLCESDSECTPPEACCFFFEQDAGVCYLITECPTVMALTATGGGQETLPPPENSNADNLFTGILLVFLAGLSFSIYHGNRTTATA